MTARLPSQVEQGMYLPLLQKVQGLNSATKHVGNDL